MSKETKKLQILGDLTPDAPAPVQADWSENDETSSAFVKGRTHYENVNMRVMYDGTPTMTGHGDGYWDGWLGEVGTFVKGAKYKVVYGGTEYELEPETVYPPGSGSGFGVSFNDADVGNVYIFNGPNSLYIETKFNIYGGHPAKTLTITEVKTERKQLAEKFIPASIARTSQLPEVPDGIVTTSTTPTSHQQLVTDADGNATWEERLAYVKSVTASKGEQIYSYTGMGTAGEPDGTSNRFELLEGNKYYLSGKVMDMSGVPNVTLDGAYTAQVTSNGTVYIGNPALLSSANEDNGLVWCITGGFWYFKHTCSYDIKVAHVEYAEDIHPLDEKFIPDTIARVTDGASLPLYLGYGSAMSREKRLTFIKKAKPHRYMEPENDGIMHIRAVTNFVASKAARGEDGSEYPAQIAAYATNSFGDPIVAYEVDVPTDDEVQEVWDAWTAMAESFA